MIDWTKPIREKGETVQYRFINEEPNGDIWLAFLLGEDWETGLYPADVAEDIFENIPEKRVVYVCEKPDGLVCVTAIPYRRNEVTACIRIEYEPGQFDD